MKAEHTDGLVPVGRLLRFVCLGFVGSAFVAGILGWWLQSVLLPHGFAEIYIGMQIASVGALVVGGVGGVLCLVLMRRQKSHRERIVDGVFIGLLQLAGIALMLFVMLQFRPARVVFVGDHLRVVSAFELQSSGRDLSFLASVKDALDGPAWFVLNWQKDAAARQALLFSELEGRDPAAQVDLHGQYAFQRVLPALREVTGAEMSALQRDRLLRSLPAEDGCLADEVGWIPIKSRLGFHTALISRRDGRLCRVENIDLWQR